MPEAAGAAEHAVIRRWPLLLPLVLGDDGVAGDARRPLADDRRDRRRPRCVRRGGRAGEVGHGRRRDRRVRRDHGTHRRHRRAAPARRRSRPLVLAACACAARADLWMFLAAHVLVGVAFACLLSGGFAGVAAFAARASEPGRSATSRARTRSRGSSSTRPSARSRSGCSWRVAEVVPAALALAALLTARNAAPVPEGAAAPRLRGVLADESARRWIGSELIAYGAWTGLLTFAGAFFIDTFDVSAGAAGWLLAAGAAAYFAAATRSGRLVARFPRRHLVALSALAMAALLPLLLGDTRSLAWAAILLLRGRRGRGRTDACVERPRPRAAAGAPGDDDGRAHGRHAARLPRRRCARRRRDRGRRLCGAEPRARGGDGAVGAARPASP